MELKVGDLIYARNVAFTEQGFPQLIKGKGYEILEKSDKFFVINSEVSDFHTFSASNFNSCFTAEHLQKERYFIVFYETSTEKGNSSVSTKGRMSFHTSTRPIVSNKWRRATQDEIDTMSNFKGNFFNLKNV